MNVHRQRREDNLQRLIQELQSHVAANNIVSNGADSVAAKIAQGIFLAHSTSDANLEEICTSGRLLPPATLHSLGRKTLNADAVERTLGTETFVFLYAAAFAFPSSGCGWLFSRSLELENFDDGAATAFDSGGLVGHFQRPDMSETPRDFFLRHELPISEHRHYLQERLQFLFTDPVHYLDEPGPCRACPVGLTGGDRRRWIHEVRIPDEVAIRSSHLQAVFVPQRLVLKPEVERFLKWCDLEGFDVETFDSDGNNDFNKLRSACIGYLRKNLL